MKELRGKPSASFRIELKNRSFTGRKRPAYYPTGVGQSRLKAAPAQFASDANNVKGPNSRGRSTLRPYDS
jgi:hypothetical protein